MNTAFRKSVLVGIAGLSVAGTVAGCAPSAQAPAAQGAPPASESAPPGTRLLQGRHLQCRRQLHLPQRHGNRRRGTDAGRRNGVRREDHAAPVESEHPQVPGRVRRRHPGPGGGQEAGRDQGFQSGRILADQRRLQPGRGEDQVTRPSSAGRNRGIVPHPGWAHFSFDGIGTRWEISTPSRLSGEHRRGCSPRWRSTTPRGPGSGPTRSLRTPPGRPAALSCPPRQPPWPSCTARCTGSPRVQ